MSGPVIQSPAGAKSGAEADAAEAVVLGEAGELVGGGGVLGVDAADALEGAGIAAEDAGEVSVIPLVVDDLDEDRAGDLVGVHEREEGLDGGVDGRDVGSGCEGEGGVLLPDVDVRVDEERLCGLGEELRGG